MIESEPNLYDFLGVARTATQEDIIKAFRQKTAQLSADTSGSPAIQRDMQILGRVYRTLTDAERRKAYDATLPPEPNRSIAGEFVTFEKEWLHEGEDPNPSTKTVVEEAPVDLESITDPAQREAHRIWQAASKEFLARPERYTPAMDGVKIIKPLTIEAEKMVVLGYDAQYANYIGYLNTGENFHVLRRLLCEQYGKSLDVRFVETTSIDEWLTIRSAELKVQRKHIDRVQARIRVESASSEYTFESGSGSWDDVMRAIEQWGAAEPDTSPRGRAIFILQYIRQVSSAEDYARAANMPNEQLRAHLNAAFTRMGELVDLDPALVALEYFRFRMQ